MITLSRLASRVITRLPRAAQRSTLPSPSPVRFYNYMAPTPWNGKYPPARRSDHVDTYKSEKHGEVKVPDPYDWLETYSEETEKWIDAEADLTRKFLEQDQNRDKFEELIKENMDYAKFSAPSLKWDGRWYWHYNSGLQAQSVLYRSKGSGLPDFGGDKTDETLGEVFFDPNLLTSDGTAAISAASFSRSGEYWAYGISLSGSDFSTIYVRPTANPLSKPIDNALANDPGRLSDVIRFVKFSGITWNHNSKGFFYHRFPDRAEHGDDATVDKAGLETTEDLDAKIYYHKVGTPQSEDILVMENPEHRDWTFGTQISELDGKYLILYSECDTSRKCLFWVTDLTENEIGPNMKWIKIIDEFDAAYEYVSNDGTKFYFKTNKDAPQYRVVSYDIADPSKGFVDVIPEDKDAHLEDIKPIDQDKFVVVYKRNVKDELYIYSQDGKQLKRLAEDFVGTIDISGYRDQSWFFATMTGFTTPGTIARYDFKSEPNWSLYRSTKVKGLKPEDFVAEQVWYNSKDGTRVPMFVVRHKDTPLDGTAPAYQYGYGGFAISISPSFSPSMLTAMKVYGFIYAVPNIRGGAEFGEDWHLAGTKERKINVYDDFIAATNFLVSNKYAAPGKVAINGGSNGGLLVAACANRAPKGTFGAAVAEVGVLDMLKFSQFTIGRAWTSDYGDPQQPHDFDYIYEYSPVHNVPTDKVLPATLLMTADHDDRVVPLHSFKYAAALQHAAPNNPNPLLIRIDRKAGHGAGKSTEKRIKDSVDRFSFIAQTLGLQWRGD